MMQQQQQLLKQRQQQQQQLLQQQQQQMKQRQQQMPVPAFQVNQQPSVVNRNSLNNNQSAAIQMQRQQEINNMAVNGGEIKGPSNVEAILNKVKSETLVDSNRITISEDSSANDRIVSSSTFQNDGSSTKRGRKKKKSNISIIT